MRNVFFSFLLLLSIISCNGKKYLSPEALKQYPLDPENGLYKAEEKNGVKLEMIYRPKDLIIAQEVEGDDPTQWKVVEEKLDTFDYFIFRLSKNGKEIQNEYASDPVIFSQVVNYLSNNMIHDLKLKVDDDTLSLANMVYVPTFGASNSSNILLIFPSSLKKQNEDFSITFNDPLFDTGVTDFQFEINDIKKTPYLKR
jgi:hypothetical protein